MYDLYPDPLSFGLREEFHDLLFGDIVSPGIGRPLLIRRIQNIPCACFTALSGSPDPSCRYCLGEGYLWTETLHTGYLGKNLGSVLGATTVISNQNALAPWGSADDSKALAYFEYSVFPNYERYLRPDHPTFDKLFELKLSDDGQLLRPYVRVAKWKMRVVTPHHGDNGRIEMIEVGLDAAVI